MFNDPPVDIPDEGPDQTPGGPEPGECRTCPTCGATMIKAGKRSWLCPNQADQGNGVSVAMRIANREMAAARVASCPF